MGSRKTDRDNDSIGRRKAKHLEICIDSSSYQVEHGSAMFEHVRLVHRSLPELNSDQVDTRAEFLGSQIAVPLFISSMTGGSKEAFKVNKDLARVAQESGIPVGAGSIRILFRNREVKDHFRLKQIAPDVPVFANIGGVQLRSEAGTLDDLVELIRELEVDGIAVHLNPGQELAQPEGDRDFKGVLDGVSRLCEKSPVPVMVKETGFGIPPDEAAALLNAGVRYVDVAGGGGTNWMTVEGHRLSRVDQAVAGEFGTWGIPTAAILLAQRDRTFTREGRVLASGGVRSGMDVVKSVVLGAVAAGMALPFVRAVSSGGIDAGLELVETVKKVVSTTMTLTGSRSVDQLRTLPVIATAELKHLASGLSELDRL